MNRSIWKIKVFIKKVRKNNVSIWNRSCVINKYNIGMYYKIHNGVALITRHIDKTMVGHRFGELSLTRRFTNKYKKVKQKLFNKKKEKSKK